MRASSLNVVVVAAVIAGSIGAVVFAQGQAAQGRAGAPAGQAAPQNLQVLPKNMTRQQVTQVMRTFTGALGVDCDHCHVGTLQERFKDDNPKKGIARKMITMTNAINAEMLKGLGTPAAGESKVTCFTCHRGAIKPLNAPGGGLVTTGHDR